MTIQDDPLFLKVSEAVDGFRKRYLERIEKEQQRLKACKINTVIQSKRAQELKLNAELKSRLAELSKRGDDLERICANFASGLTISDRDQQRLDNAKEMYEIGKKLTGIRFDFSAPPTVVKGYIKSETRRTLAPFELDISADVSESLWALIQGSVADKENKLPN
ncbi:uncharacterized protein LOC126378998 [Pectinophora gossypiella]|uniref:uncharacterized protein LOC126378998 n=1 Tax=Pectinophora gossypiella TaxID=13191 RepID=UPI00214EB515|nr:uncharacterized protein LOC126378998 [Pectinophora gossypiella]